MDACEPVRMHRESLVLAIDRTLSGGRMQESRLLMALSAVACLAIGTVLGVQLGYELTRPERRDDPQPLPPEEAKEE